MKDRISKAISNPGLAAKFVLNNLSKASQKHILNRGATIYQQQSLDEVPTSPHDAILHSLFDDLKISPKDHEDFRTYLEICDFAHYHQCDSILEIGAGLSTAIWAEYGKENDADVTSIDADFDRFSRWITGTRHQQTIDEYVDQREGLSIESGDLREFYGQSHTEFAGTPVGEIEAEIDRFARATGCPASRIKAMNTIAGERNWSVSDIIIADGSLRFPKSFLDFYVKGHETLDDLIETMENTPNTGIIDDLTEETDGWDLVWLDSGEVSSMVEWLKIKDHINSQGLVALHDVFFPKSMKNFVVAASLFSDPEWEVLLLDPSTKQGLLIAQRKS